MEGVSQKKRKSILKSASVEVDQPTPLQAHTGGDGVKFNEDEIQHHEKERDGDHVIHKEDTPYQPQTKELLHELIDEYRVHFWSRTVFDKVVHCI